jgi:hypothetical protein
MIIIGSWHKTGTVLLSTIFEILHKLENKQFTYKTYINFSQCTDEEIKHNKCIVVIRHPYEIICSGVRYHEHSKEKWLHEKQTCYNNKSYQEMIQSLDTDNKILFEMKQCARNNIFNIYNDMKNRNNNNNILFVPLEDLTDPAKMAEICDKIIRHISSETYVFTYDNIMRAIQTSMHLNKDHRTNTDNTITYRNYFKDEHYIEFKKIFPEDLFTTIGYNHI